MDRKELFNAIFDITAYCPPPSIILPKGYGPPKLAISKLYWKGWILLLVLSAFNPTTVGESTCTQCVMQPFWYIIVYNVIIVKYEYFLYDLPNYM